MREGADHNVYNQADLVAVGPAQSRVENEADYLLVSLLLPADQHQLTA